MNPRLKEIDRKISKASDMLFTAFWAGLVVYLVVTGNVGASFFPLCVLMIAGRAFLAERRNNFYKQLTDRQFDVIRDLLEGRTSEAHAKWRDLQAFLDKEFKGRPEHKRSEK